MLDGQPALYARLMPSFFREEIPEERKATCASCVMVKPQAASEQAAFNAATKCCTYHPKLPNYLVGALFAENLSEFAEGRARLRERLSRRAFVTPQWVMPSPKHDLIYKNTSTGFGRAASLRCPYYGEEGGLCTIWPYREAVCSTFFCKNVGGADGKNFWMSMKRYLSLAEIQLSRYALLQHFPAWVVRQGDSPKSGGGGDLSLEDLDGLEGDPARHAAEWGPWVGREEELYVKCYETVQALSQEDFARLLGLDGDVHVKVLAELRRTVLKPQLAARPKLNPGLTVKYLDDGDVALGFHSPYDWVALPEPAFRLLALFRGVETLSEVRARLQSEHETDFADEVLEELHRHRILI